MKKPVFVDTNVFLRFFVKDDPGMFEKSRALFARTESGTRHLRVINRAMLQEATRLFKEGSMDFVDACALASAGQAGCTSIATFDRRHFRQGRLPLYWE